MDEINALATMPPHLTRTNKTDGRKSHVLGLRKGHSADSRYMYGVDYGRIDIGIHPL